ncbi:MAG TPA: hypothetical protein VKZ54_13635, partial [Membranihabitans sp.]|nr:hypothetical protein [Membranihabitans sp.]
WKIIREGEEEEWQLYNLDNDISETTNLAKSQPKITSKLSAAFDQKQKEIIHYLEIEKEFQRPKD